MLPVILPTSGRSRQGISAAGVSPAVIATLTFSQAPAEHVRIIAWRRRCERKIELDTAELVERYGAAITVIDWAARLRYCKCSARAAPYLSVREVAAGICSGAIGLKARSRAIFNPQA